MGCVFGMGEGRGGRRIKGCLCWSWWSLRQGKKEIVVGCRGAFIPGRDRSESWATDPLPPLYPSSPHLLVCMSVRGVYVWMCAHESVNVFMCALPLELWTNKLTKWELDWVEDVSWRCVASCVVYCLFVLLYLLYCFCYSLKASPFTWSRWIK